MDSIIIAGIDPSTKTGLCIVKFFVNGTIPEIIVCREIQCKLLQNKKWQYYQLIRGMYIANEVSIECLKHHVDICLIENYAYGNRFTLSLLTEMCTLLKYKLYTINTPYLTIAPTQLKKFITGSGKSSKIEMARHCNERYNFVNKNHNIVDAFSLAMTIGTVYTQDISVGTLNKKNIETVLVEKFNVSGK